MDDLTASILGEVERRLAELSARPVEATLRAATLHLTMAPGAKRMRPLLVAASGRTFGAGAGVIADLACAAELVHTASLLHDDVVDHGLRRRGAPTVNARFGDRVAVLAGDWLLTLALDALRPHGTAVTAAALEAVLAMTEAAVTELEARRDLTVDLARCRQVALGKTGALFSFSLVAPAIATGHAEAADRLGAAGLALGVAFQIADDLLDFQPERSGKDAFADLREGNPSMVIAEALERSPDLAAVLTSLWEGRGDVGAVAKRIEQTGAIDAVRLQLRDACDGAVDALGPYRERPGLGSVVGDIRALSQAHGGTA